MIEDARKQALNHGQTWQEFLAGLGESEEVYSKRVKEDARSRIKAGIAIGEIAKKEGLSVSDSEVEASIAKLKQTYSDPAMQEELNKPANQREIAMRLLTERVLDFLQTTLG